MLVLRSAHPQTWRGGVTGEHTGLVSATFGVRLRRLREAAALTQEELAARAGLTVKAVGVLERGERGRSYPHTVRSLAGALRPGGDDRAALVAAAQRPAAAAEESSAAVLPVPGRRW